MCRRVSLLITLSILCAVACSAPALAAQPSGPITTTTKQELIVGEAADTQRPDVRADLGMYPVHVQVYDTLVVTDDHFQLLPELADRWDYQGNNTWLFTLH